MAVNALHELGPQEAQAWFEALPREQRVRSLAPDFAQADTVRAPGLACLHVGYAEGASRWLHTTHLVGIAGFGCAVLSPYAYGGPLCNTADAGFAARAWQAWQRRARERAVLGEFCRFHPEAAHQCFFGGEVSCNRSTISVDLLQEPVEAQFNSLARRKLRRAAHVPVRWSTAPADWLAFGAFYRAAMAAMGAHERYRFGDAYFGAIARLPGAELCICGDAEWLSAGVYLFQARLPQDHGPGGTVEYHLGANSAAGHAAGTAYLMQYTAATEGRRRGLAHLYLGGGRTPRADDPLLFYKRAFSRRERLFHVGRAIHDEALFARYAEARGYHPDAAPPNLLFD